MVSSKTAVSFLLDHSNGLLPNALLIF